MQQVEPARGVRRAEQFQQLIADALGAHFADGGGVLLHGGERRRGDLEPKLRGEAHGAEQPQPVLAEAFCRGADGADAPGLEVGPAADPVVHLVGERVVKQAVDGEVAPQGILARVGESHAAGAPTVGVVALSAEGGHLIFVAGLEHHDHAVLFANRDGFAEQLLDLIRRGVGGDVVVGRRLAKPVVTHAPTHPIRLKPGPGEALGQAVRTGLEAVGVGLDFWVHGWATRAVGPVFPENQPRASRGKCWRQSGLM